MTEWDTLWEDIDWDRVTTIPFITERLHAIKTEGDKLKEKAEKYERSKAAHKETKLALIKCNNAWAKQYDQLEAVKEFVLSRRDDIEKDIEDFGMLKPVLNYFLKEDDGNA